MNWQRIKRALGIETDRAADRYFNPESARAMHEITARLSVVDRASSDLNKMRACVAETQRLRPLAQAEAEVTENLTAELGMKPRHLVGLADLGYQFDRPKNPNAVIGSRAAQARLASLREITQTFRRIGAAGTAVAEGRRRWERLKRLSKADLSLLESLRELDGQWTPPWPDAHGEQIRMQVAAIREAGIELEVEESVTSAHFRVRLP